MRGGGPAPPRHAAGRNCGVRPAHAPPSAAGKKDLALLPDAARKGFHAFLTKDGRQLEIPSEAAAIKKSGCTTSDSVMGTGEWPDSV